MSELETIYRNMWLNAEQKILAGQYDIDTLIGSEKDTRRGMTLLSYLHETDGPVSRRLMAFNEELARHEPDQYFYPENELHLTILSIISCIEGFRLTDIDSAAYREIIREATRHIGPLEIHCKGITASAACVVVQGYPLNDQLEALRDGLRVALGNSSLSTTMDSRYKLATAHSTIARFQAPLRNSHRLIELLRDYRDYDFGVYKVHQVDLVFNNWYQHLSQTQHLARLALNPYQANMSSVETLMDVTQ